MAAAGGACCRGRLLRLLRPRALAVEHQPAGARHLCVLLPEHALCATRRAPRRPRAAVESAPELRSAVLRQQPDGPALPGKRPLPPARRRHGAARRSVREPPRCGHVDPPAVQGDGTGTARHARRRAGVRVRQHDDRPDPVGPHDGRTLHVAAGRHALLRAHPARADRPSRSGARDRARPGGPSRLRAVRLPRLPADRVPRAVGARDPRRLASGRRARGDRRRAHAPLPPRCRPAGPRHGSRARVGPQRAAQPRRDEPLGFPCRCGPRGTPWCWCRACSSAPPC